MAINCCNGCVPPKRTGDCHVTCPDYIIDSVFNKAEMAEAKQQQAISNDIYHSRSDKVNTAMRRRRNKKYG